MVVVLLFAGSAGGRKLVIVQPARCRTTLLNLLHQLLHLCISSHLSARKLEVSSRTCKAASKVATFRTLLIKAVPATSFVKLCAESRAGQAFLRACLLQVPCLILAVASGLSLGHEGQRLRWIYLKAH